MSLDAPTADLTGGVLASAVNVYEAEKNRQWQSDMSGSAHQREVQDLKKAGLNPILSAGGGPGASTPPGALTNVENPAKNIAQDNLQSSQKSLMEEQANSAMASANLAGAQLTKTDAERNQINTLTPLLAVKAGTEALYNSAQTVKSKTEQRGEAMQNVQTQAETDLYKTPLGKIILPLLDKITGHYQRVK
jgi:hypothetical protein